MFKIEPSGSSDLQLLGYLNFMEASLQSFSFCASEVPQSSFKVKMAILQAGGPWSYERSYPIRLIFPRNARVLGIDSDCRQVKRSF